MARATFELKAKAELKAEQRAEREAWFKDGKDLFRQTRHAVYDAERPRLAPSTVTLTVNYLTGARLGDWLEARVRIDRLGGRTAYTSGAIWRAEEMIATMSGVFAVRRP
jgi:acyl-coenzyme A thioesterase PaaI-like protein